MTILNEQELKELKDLIAIGHYKPNLLNDYKSWYLRIFNKRWTGCNCSASTMYHELKQYLISNKL